MFSSIEITDFRGIERIALEGLGRVNLVVGPNSSSKTALLDAILMLSLDGNSEALLRLTKPEDEDSDIEGLQRAFEWLRRRHGAGVGRSGPVAQGQWNGTERRAELSFETPSSRQIAAGTDVSKGGGSNGSSERSAASGAEFGAIAARASFVATLRTTTEDGHERLARVALIPGSPRGEIVVQNDPRAPAIKCLLMHGQMHSDSALALLPELISDAEALGALDGVVEFLRRFDPHVKALRVGVGTRRHPVARVIHDSLGLTPVSALGSGFVATATMLLALRRRGVDVALMDEFDSSLHVGIIQELLPRMLDIARESDIQIFASTHRSDTLEGVVELDADQLKDIRIIQTSRIHHQVTAKVINGDSAKRLTGDLGLDLRQPT